MDRRYIILREFLSKTNNPKSVPVYIDPKWITFIRGENIYDDFPITYIEFSNGRHLYVADNVEEVRKKVFGVG